jgi:hypothetical protein
VIEQSISQTIYEIVAFLVIIVVNFDMKEGGGRGGATTIDISL